MSKVKVRVKKKSKEKKEKREKKISGRTLGLNVRETWRQVLMDNFKRKLTDEQISKFMQKEFPDRKARQITRVSGVRSLRRSFNKGRLFEDKRPPARLSVPYDTAGNVLSLKRGGKEKADKAEKSKGHRKTTVATKKAA